MSVYTSLKEIANSKDVSIYRIERDLNFTPGRISKWDKSMPGADVLQEVASYLGVTSEFILSNAKDETN